MATKSGNLIKGMAVGVVIATAVTMALTNKKTMVKKAKDVVNTTSDNVTSLLNKMN